MDLEFGVDDPCEQLGAAQVQADRLRGAQGAADGTDQVAKLIAIGDEDKVRVREKEVDVDSPSKVEVETPNKKIEVK
jgi:hypothetical protein